MITKITTHVQDAENRLIQQYKDKPNIQAILDALVAPFQNLEDSADDLNNKRWIVNAAGVQLDLLGGIVGIARNGLSDDVYRTRIRIKVIQNISQGEPERLIQVYGSLLGATLVNYQENYPAGANMMANAYVTPGQETVVYNNVQNIAPAGVRVDYIGCFPPRGFAFGGGVTQSKGFGSFINPTVGGGLGKMHIPVKVLFSFTGGNPDNQGFGSIYDPYMGGHFITK